MAAGERLFNQLNLRSASQGGVNLSGAPKPIETEFIA
jgi:hypothetical protein